MVDVTLQVIKQSGLWNIFCPFYLSINDTKTFVPVVTLSAQVNSNLTTQIWIQYLDYLFDPNFQGIKRL